MLQNNDDLLKRVEALELGKRVEDLELGADATSEEVQLLQMEHLKQLRTIRAALGEGGSSSPKEMEALQDENTLLLRQSAKQDQRIQHLEATVEELLAKRH